MNLSNTGPREQLSRFAAALGEQGFATQLAEASEQTPYDVLLVFLSEEELESGGWQLELSFVPDMEEQLEGLSLLQFFVPIPAVLDPAAVAETMRAAVVLNRKIPLVGFGVLDEPAMACFRHTLLIPAEPAADIALVVQSTWLVSYLLGLFGRNVMEVASGRARLTESLLGHPFAHLFQDAEHH